MPILGNWLRDCKNACYARVLTYCTNGRTTVPTYADADRLLVFVAPLTSVSLSKKEFFDRLTSGIRIDAACI